MNMKAKILGLLFILIGFTKFAVSQDNTYNDLLLLFVDEKYEKCLKKAEKYTTDPETKKDPYPWFYMSKSLLEISESELGNKDIYKKAFKDAIKYAGKGINYDARNEGDAREYFEDHIIELKKSIRIYIDDYISSGSFKNAGNWAKQYLRVAPNNPGANLILCTASYNAKDRTKAREYYAKAKEVIDEMDGFNSDSGNDFWILKIGIIEYALFMCPNSSTKTQAVAMLNVGKQWFEEEDDFMRVYNQCVNGVNTSGDE
jgi:tetratricopeptide (TPR) repeat protein